MQDREFFSQVIGVEAPWQVKDVKLEMAEGKVTVLVEAQTDYQWHSEDGHRLHIHGWEERRWRHLDTMQLETVIKAQVPRLLDPRDNSTKIASVPWAKKGGRWTLFFEAWAIRLMLAVPNVSRAAALLRLDWHSAWEIKQRAVVEGLSRRAEEPMEYLGLDEKSFGKRQDFAVVLTDPAGKRVLDVKRGRTQESAEEVIEASLSLRQKEHVQAVSIDMWEAFENAVNHVLPQARVVYDPFHLVSHANKAVDDIRRAEHREHYLSGDMTLKGSRQLWLWGEENLDTERRQRLQELLKSELKTGLAWALKESLRSLWTYRRPSAARSFLDEWITKAEATGLAPLKRVAKMIASHMTGIIAWFWHPISNGPAEGFNSAIQTLKVTARGYRNFENFRTSILFHHGKLDLIPR